MGFLFQLTDDNQIETCSWEYTGGQGVKFCKQKLYW